MKSGIKGPWHSYIQHYLMLLPFLILFVMFFIYPILSGFRISFFTWNAVHEAKFIGLKNYRTIIGSDIFFKAFGNLLKYILFTVPIGITTAFILALIVNSFSKFWASLFKSGYFVPFMMPLFLAATLWRWIYAPDFGLLNTVLGRWGFESINFLNDPDNMLFSLILVDVWVSSGLNMVILLAGMKNIPDSYYEAAKVEGANFFQQIVHITVPQLEPIFFFVITWGFISALQVFDVPWILTTSNYLNYGGRQQALLFPVMDIMGRAFGGLQFGQASAYGFILTTFIVIMTWLQFLLRKRRDQ